MNARWWKEWVDERVWGALALLLLGGVLNVFLLGYLVALVVYFRESKLTAGENAFHLMSDPLQAVSVLIFNGGTQAVEQSIHHTYTNEILQGAFWLLMLYVVYRLLWYRKPKHKKAAEEGSHGTADWQSSREIKRNYLQDSKGMVIGEYQGKMAVHPLNNHNRLNSNALIFGGSGSAKTAGFVIPNILHIAETLGHSLVLSDPKGELWNITSKHLKDLGYEVIPFNLLDKEKRRSARFNPMANLKRNGRVMTDEVVELAHMIMEATKKEREDGFFASNAKDLLTALMLYVLEARPKEEHHLRNVLFLASTIGKDHERLRNLFDQLPINSDARSFFDNCDSKGAEKQWEGIRGDMKTRLSLWNLKSIAELTAASDFDLNQLGKKKTALYLMMPDSDTTYALLPTLLITQAFKTLIQQADANPDRSLEVPTWFILDELGNLPKIKDLDQKVSTVRSRKIYLMMIFQSVPQFQGHYGKLESASIDDSCDLTIYLGAKSNQTNKEFSEMLGMTTIQVPSTSYNTGTEGRTKSESYKERNLLRPDEVRKIRRNDEVLVFQTGYDPVRLKKHMYFKQKKWDAVREKEVHWLEDIPRRKYSPVPLFEEALNEVSEEVPSELLPQ